MMMMMMWRRRMHRLAVSFGNWYSVVAIDGQVGGRGAGATSRSHIAAS